MPAPEYRRPLRNPYLNRVMIRDAAHFYGRRREVAKIFARIGSARPQSVAIVGERRIGKSSLLNHLCQPEIRRQYLEDQGSYAFVFIDLQEQREIGIPSFFENLFRGIEKALGQTRPANLPADYEGARRALLRLQEEGRKIILLFDEFDAITRNPNFPEEFFAFLRAVANKYDVAYVTTSGQDLQQLCHAERIADSPFFNIFSNLFLTRFEPEEALALIREPSSGAGVPLAPYAADIIDMAGLFPFFIQVACSAFFEQLAEGSAFDLGRVRASFLEEAEPHFNYICKHFDADQRRVLMDVAEGRPVPPSHSYLLNKLKRDGYLLEENGRDRLFSSPFVTCLKEGSSVREATASGALDARESVPKQGAAMPFGDVPRQEAEMPVGGAPAPDVGATAPRQDQGPILVGRQIGVYTILAPIGAGGMGEVYRAKDTKLGRDVAIKILPASFAADPDRVRRFEREARLLAALNHPNIGAIYGFEQTEGIHALVLELVEGPTLADKLASGSGLQALGQPRGHAAVERNVQSPTSGVQDRKPGARSGEPGAEGRRTQGLPVDEALAIAKQIALALESAHEKGIVHRDLKPANIKITAREAPQPPLKLRRSAEASAKAEPPRAEDLALEGKLSRSAGPEGVVKVLDFGLAKELPSEELRIDLSRMATRAADATLEGVIAGTAAYMSPEQARGKPVDKRTDVWAFGCVLYEMLSGWQAFYGETLSDTIGKVLEREPDWHALPAGTPAKIHDLLRRCLQKDPERRLHDIADARIEIEEARTALTGPHGSAGRQRWWRRKLGLWIGAVALMASLAAAGGL